MKRLRFLIPTILVIALFVCAVVVSGQLPFADYFTKPEEYYTSTTVPPTEAPTEEPLTQEATTQAPSTDRELKISFVGDCMLGSMLGNAAEGSFNQYAKQYPNTYFFEKVSSYFLDDDYTIGNCEGVLSDSELTPKARESEVQFWFKGPASHADIFKVGGFDYLSTVNNHSKDFGMQGYEDTVEALKSRGLDVGERDKILIREVSGIKLGLYSCSLYSYDYVYDILEKVEQLKSEGCKLIIIYFHGGIENVEEPEDWKIKACREIVDAGADLVVGSHPHRLQRAEEYNGGYIVYSLGNFCFGGNSYPKNETAIYTACFTVIDEEIAARKDIFIPCYVYTGSENNYQPAVIEDQEKIDKIISHLLPSEG